MPKPRSQAVLKLAALAMGLTLVCGGCDALSDAAGSGRPTVVTTFTVLADIAENVAGDDIDVESLTPVGTEIHQYDPTPSDLKKAAGADLVLDNGMGLEAWFSRFLDQSGAEHVVVSDGVEPIPISGGSYDGSANPHAWMSPLNTKVYVDNMVEAFSDLDPEHADDFERRGTAYKRELDAVHSELTETLERLPASKRALVTCEGAFSYLARDAGLEEQYLWPTNSDEQGTPQQVSATVEFVRANDVPAVFCETTVSDKTMQQVASESGADFGGSLYVDSLSEADGDVPDYLSLLRYDVALITDGLVR